MGKVFAPAKINLTLHVTGKRADGYHLLDSLVMFADVGDTIRVSPAAKTTLTVSGPRARGVPVDERNIMIRAAALARVGATMHLTKVLPHAAGIGGGSSDAAATLRALSDLSGMPIPGNAHILGADLPVCLLGQTARMRGVGEKVEALPGMPSLHAVLVNPNQPVLTAEVFKRLKQSDNAPMPQEVPQCQTAAELIDWLRKMRNDLEAPAIETEPVIKDVFSALTVTPGCMLTRMSGSGGTCFGLYSDAETAASAAGRLSEQNPGWWVVAVRLNP
ncbi:MAG: 4-(cytidine 5'-diphospho)-2-C-methyl-D-erythritol kinase [Roseovarius sp.]|nr:4-(cytidine 5'-diphospho)-2-C-methyl-D-erythritol kinase [Roseovarius sp.]